MLTSCLSSLQTPLLKPKTSDFFIYKTRHAISIIVHSCINQGDYKITFIGEEKRVLKELSENVDVESDVILYWIILHIAKHKLRFEVLICKILDPEFSSLKT
ncbi:hypothetical protein Anas_11929 [Armadillidium nasatum]|uniref:Uncharacterized protein n=1 Tax=Armadillidium nasatum TaxID=96803 RepID=A0A5N5SW33_9CRUS|nr:hypothetical protein Anas_11929 [Armadillidium nasatum]